MEAGAGADRTSRGRVVSVCPESPPPLSVAIALSMYALRLASWSICFWRSATFAASMVYRPLAVSATRSAPLPACSFAYKLGERLRLRPCRRACPSLHAGRLSSCREQDHRENGSEEAPSSWHRSTLVGPCWLPRKVYPTPGVGTGQSVAYATLGMPTLLSRWLAFAPSPVTSGSSKTRTRINGQQPATRKRRFAICRLAGLDKVAGDLIDGWDALNSTNKSGV